MTILPNSTAFEVNTPLKVTEVGVDTGCQHERRIELKEPRTLEAGWWVVSVPDDGDVAFDGPYAVRPPVELVKVWIAEHA